MAFRLVLLLAAAVSMVSAGWQLDWSDEFDGPAGSAPDGSKWGYDIGGGGWGNNELEYYTSSTNNAQLDGNGFLNIIARNDDAWQYGCWYGTCSYTSARLKTQGKFDQKWGRFEARMRLPRGGGLWPAFWSLGVDIDSAGWPNCGEIDIMEIRGSQPSTALGTIHGPGYSGAGGLSGSYTLPGGTFNDDFHVFAVEWNENSITWYVDNTAYETRTPGDVGGNTWVFNHNFFIILNLAVGGNFDGNPDGSYGFPQYVNVDYVRVYNWV